MWGCGGLICQIKHLMIGMQPGKKALNVVGIDENQCMAAKSRYESGKSQ